MKPDSFFKEIPKVELHIHLEGAIPLKTLYNLARRKNEPGIETPEDLARKLQDRDFENFVTTWTWKNTLIMEESDFSLITYEVLKELSAHNVKYVEMHYSPGDYHRTNFSLKGITENVLKGRKRAAHDLGIRSAFILDLIRDHGPEKGREYLDMATDYLDQGIIGIGLGGSEHLFPPAPYKDLFSLARKRGFHTTAHAGEAAGAESIFSAIRELGIERIGHGTRAYEDPSLIYYLKQRQIPLEMCVMSNVKTGVVKSPEEHPVRKYFSEQLFVTINSDDPTMFGTSISNEYKVLYEKCGFTVHDLMIVSLNGINASYLSEQDKWQYKALFQEEWRELFSKY